MAQPNKPPKTMSSRLMTMKFMQRAAGAASPTTPSSSSPSTPAQQPSAKRQRLSNGSYHQSSAASTPDHAEFRAMREAVVAEEQKRLEALEREAADRGETKWYLSFQEPSRKAVKAPLRVVSAGFSTLDRGDDRGGRSNNDDEDDDEDQDDSPGKSTVQGRRSFGRFNRAVEKRADPDVSSDDSDSQSESDEDGDDEDQDIDDPDGTDAMINEVRREAAEKARAERKAKRKAEKAEAERLASERRKKTVNLNKIQSISGGGGTPSGSPSARDIVCFKCNRKGHKAMDCPQSRGSSLR